MHLDTRKANDKTLTAAVLALALSFTAQLRTDALSRANRLSHDSRKQSAAPDVERGRTAGANVDALTRNGWTPLQLAAYWGPAEMAQALPDAGANAAARYGDGKTPFDCAEDPEGTDVYWRLNQGRFA